VRSGSTCSSLASSERNAFAGNEAPQLTGRMAAADIEHPKHGSTPGATEALQARIIRRVAVHVNRFRFAGLREAIRELEPCLSRGIENFGMIPRLNRLGEWF
jgi:hypothetical protein